MTDLPTRRPSVTVTGEYLSASVSFDPRTGAPCEVFFVSRGKTGTDLNEELEELSIQISRIMQHR
jgi:hypothetical protein